MVRFSNRSKGQDLKPNSKTTMAYQYQMDQANHIRSQDWALYWNKQVDEEKLHRIYEKQDEIIFIVWTTERFDKQTIAWVQTKNITHRDSIQRFFKDVEYIAVTFGDEEFSAWFRRNDRDHFRFRRMVAPRDASGEPPERNEIVRMCREEEKRVIAEEVAKRYGEMDPFIDASSDVSWSD